MAERVEFSDEERRLLAAVLSESKGSPVTNVELDLFVRQAIRTQLDPFDRLIYASFRNNRRTGNKTMQVQATIDGFRLTAERSGKYLGQDGPYWCGEDGAWVDVWLKPEPPVAAKVGVWKQGAKSPTNGVALFKEYAQRGQGGKLIGLWPSMPSNQLAKCAEALALRKAFPDKLSGIYTTEEMEQADNPEPITAPVASEPPPVASNGKGDATPSGDIQPAESTAAGPQTPEPNRKPESAATPAEIEALRELIRVTETADPTVRMLLMDFGLDDVGPVDEILPRLTVAQAIHVMTKINERLAA